MGLTVRGGNEVLPGMAVVQEREVISKSCPVLHPHCHYLQTVGKTHSCGTALCPWLLWGIQGKRGHRVVRAGSSGGRQDLDEMRTPLSEIQEKASPTGIAGAPPQAGCTPGTADSGMKMRVSPQGWTMWDGLCLTMGGYVCKAPAQCLAHTRCTAMRKGKEVFCTETGLVQLI